MKPIYVYAISALLLSLSGGAAQAAGGATLLQQTVEEVLDENCLDSEQTAVSVASVPNGKLLYARNTEKPLLPASIVKMLTTAAALHYLGPEYRFHTDLLHSGVREADSIQGDLILRGGGDPLLTIKEIMYMVSRIKHSGVRLVTGSLIVDDSFFDAYDRAPAWDESRTQRPYDAKIGALSIDFNTVAVHIEAGREVGDPVNAWLEPAPAYLKIHNEGRTVEKGSTTVWARRNRVKGEQRIEIRGRLPQSASERVVLVNIDNPARFAAETFRALLLEAGVRIAGPTRINGPEPQQTTLIYRHSSPSLSVVLKELNTYSNNFVAEQILKTMAAEHYGAPGSHARGIAMVMDFLRKSGVNTRGVVLADASGLSRENRFTARAMTEFLNAVLKRFDIAPDFMASLRVMGADGVLSQRLKDSPARAQIRAKTGSLRKVSNLAGYVAGAEGRLYAYTLMLNNNSCGYRTADKLEDRIVTAIHTLDGNNRNLPLISSMWSGENIKK